MNDPKVQVQMVMARFRSAMQWTAPWDKRITLNLSQEISSLAFYELQKILGCDGFRVNWGQDRKSLIIER